MSSIPSMGIKQIRNKVDTAEHTCNPMTQETNWGQPSQLSETLPQSQTFKGLEYSPILGHLSGIHEALNSILHSRMKNKINTWYPAISFLGRIISKVSK